MHTLKERIKRYPSQEELKELFIYKDGELFWKNPSNRVDPDLPAGNINEENNYRGVLINKFIYTCQRLTYIYHYGDIPEGSEVNHKNHNKADNHIENLRLVTRQERMKNLSKNKNNISGVAGVEWRKDMKKWIARITSNKKTYYLGIYSNKEYAIMARTLANMYFGFHENHGR